MPIVVVRVDAPIPGNVLPRLVEGTPLTETETADLYRSALRDVSEAVAGSGADLLVTYRERDGVDEDVETLVKEAVTPALETPDAVRFEVEVGSSPAARIGNTVTHLLESEGASSAAVLDPTAVLAARPRIDQASMQLRRNDLVLGPAANGEVFYAGFGEPIDFGRIDSRPDLEGLVNRANDEDLAITTVEMAPTLRTPAQLQSALPILRARREAGDPIPVRTVARLEELGLQTVENENGDSRFEQA